MRWHTATHGDVRLPTRRLTPVHLVLPRQRHPRASAFTLSSFQLKEMGLKFLSALVPVTLHLWPALTYVKSHKVWVAVPLCGLCWLWHTVYELLNNSSLALIPW